MTLNQEEQGVLDQIISARSAWIPLQGLMTSVVDRLQSLGLIVKWATDAMGHAFKDGPYVTLTPLGAELRHVTLIEKVEGYPYWTDAKKAERREKRHLPIRIRGWIGLAFPELIEDRKPYMLDEYGEPVYLFKVLVPIDPKLSRNKIRRRHYS